MHKIVFLKAGYHLYIYMNYARAQYLYTLSHLIFTIALRNLVALTSGLASKYL